MNKFILIALIILFLTVLPNASIAGTTQIYSPAGLPQSSGPVIFTPPLEGMPGTLGAPSGGLKNFSAAPLPMSHTAGPPPERSSETLSQPENGKVESFFQCPSLNQPTLRTKQPSPSMNAGKFVWHVLDNIGIPMFGVSKHTEEDLDPSLRSTPSAIPYPTNIPQQSIPRLPQKIPESELEGTEIPLKDEIQTP